MQLSWTGHDIGGIYLMSYDFIIFYASKMLTTHPLVLAGVPQMILNVYFRFYIIFTLWKRQILCVSANNMRYLGTNNVNYVN